MSKRTSFFFDERAFWHSAGQYNAMIPVGRWVQPSSAGGYVDSPESKRRLKNLMDVAGLSAKLSMCSGEAASERDLLRIHPQAYVDRFKELSKAGSGELGFHAPVGPGSYEVAAISAGLAIAAVQAVFKGDADNAYALSRPAGHHCLPDQGMGACLLANIAIAIEAAKADGGLGKVAVLDWDVHHGNGTQSIFYSRSDVLTLSIHQEGCFPPGYSGAEDRGVGDGEGANINIPLLPGSGHASYIEAMRRIVIPALERFKPDLIIVASGFDANAVDPMARMLLHSDSFREMTRMVKDAAQRLCNGRLVVVHEGGYSEAYVPFCALAVVEELSGVRTEVDDPLRDWIEQQQPRTAQRDLQSELISQMVNDLGLPMDG
ncbi:class II histone deacetylase [Pseudomonas sp. S32]|uniref:class II histone deacetylase n=1 Tax=Pseudomonas sp. S32 TaxID=2767448 RepID=UPI0019113189|nr:class II histone deacetylase [Pseudomonas sp. S32]MBK5006930.1 class II histone deacetylase [Pseudomonas sp. S32]